MRDTAGHRRESICCAKGNGFVLHDFGGMNGTDNVVLASLALCVAHHTMDWLLERGLANTGFCVRAAAAVGADGALMGSIALATDLKGIAIDDPSRADLQDYVGQRLRPSALRNLADGSGGDRPVLDCRGVPASRAAAGNCFLGLRAVLIPMPI